MPKHRHGKGEDMKKTMTEIMTTSIRKKLSKQGIDAIPFFSRGRWGFTHDNAGYIIDDIKDFHFVKVVDYTEKFG
jgi:hypothetical protein